MTLTKPNRPLHAAGALAVIFVCLWVIWSVIVSPFVNSTLSQRAENAALRERVIELTDRINAANLEITQERGARALTSHAPALLDTAKASAHLQDSMRRLISDLNTHKCTAQVLNAPSAIAQGETLLRVTAALTARGSWSDCVRGLKKAAETTPAHVQAMRIQPNGSSENISFTIELVQYAAANV
ncbi:MAG: hypothetical protein AAGC95_05950 [Pseudomonadota bacterium]